ncbi:MAG: 50S ribosomal protein L21 [Candidatus Hydrogenedentales bacterium]
MYAVIATGGKQVKLAPGDRVRVEKLDGDVGSTIELGEVRLLAKDDGLEINPEKLAGAKVVCQITAQDRAKKIRVFKKKRRKNYRRTAGHRQSFTELKVTDIKV